MPNLLDMLRDLSVFAILTMAVSVGAFGLAVSSRDPADRAKADADAAGVARGHLRHA